MKSVVIIVSSIVIFVVCCAINLFGYNASKDDSYRALKMSGYSNIQLQGYAFFACSKNEYSRKFTAMNAKGEAVNGTICCGLWKNCTVRF